MAQTTVFKHRKKSWQERQHASKHSIALQRQPHAPYESNLDDNTLVNNEHIHPEPHLLNVEGIVNQYMNSLTVCPSCQNEDASTLCDKNLDGDAGMWVKHCKSCDEIFGVDDSSSVYDVNEKLKHWNVNMCICGNKDLFMYEVTSSDSEGIHLVCKCCSRETVIEKSPQPNVESIQVPPVLSCECGNDQMTELECYQEDETDQITGMMCCRCHRSWLLESSADYNKDIEEQKTQISVVDSEVIRVSRPVGREEVRDAWDVREADHIAWWRCEGYWHHALVEHVYPQTNELDVIHYNGPSPTGQFIKGKIVKEKIDLGKQPGLLYRLKYDGPCFERNTTMIRAETRMDEVNYNLFTNNCEHFVCWCKTGFDCSIQVKKFCETMIRIGKKATSCFSKEVTKKGIQTFATRILGCAVLKEATAASSEAFLAAAGARYICEFVGVGAIVAIEGISVVRDIHKAHKQKKEGHISNQEFWNITVRRSMQGSLGAMGAVGGGYVGSVLIPIPIVGAMVGCTLGALIGHGLGHMAGYIYASNQRKK